MKYFGLEFEYGDIVLWMSPGAATCCIKPTLECTHCGIIVPSRKSPSDLDILEVTVANGVTSWPLSWLLSYRHQFDAHFEATFLRKLQFRRRQDSKEELVRFVEECVTDLEPEYREITRNFESIELCEPVSSPFTAELCAAALQRIGALRDDVPAQRFQASTWYERQHPLLSFKPSVRFGNPVLVNIADIDPALNASSVLEKVYEKAVVARRGSTVSVKKLGKRWREKSAANAKKRAVAAVRKELLPLRRAHSSKELSGTLERIHSLLVMETVDGVMEIDKAELAEIAVLKKGEQPELWTREVGDAFGKMMRSLPRKEGEKPVDEEKVLRLKENDPFAEAKLRAEKDRVEMEEEEEEEEESVAVEMLEPEEEEAVEVPEPSVDDSSEAQAIETAVVAEPSETSSAVEVQEEEEEAFEVPEPSFDDSQATETAVVAEPSETSSAVEVQEEEEEAVVVPEPSVDDSQATETAVVAEPSETSSAVEVQEEEEEAVEVAEPSVDDSQATETAVVAEPSETSSEEEAVEVAEPSVDDSQATETAVVAEPSETSSAVEVQEEEEEAVVVPEPSVDDSQATETSSAVEVQEEEESEPVLVTAGGDMEDV